MFCEYLQCSFILGSSTSQKIFLSRLKRYYLVIYLLTFYCIFKPYFTPEYTAIVRCEVLVFFCFSYLASRPTTQVVSGRFTHLTVRVTHVSNPGSRCYQLSELILNILFVVYSINFNCYLIES